MEQDEFLCARCARHQSTCCQWTDIHVTRGDVERIASHTGRSDFTELRGVTSPVYLEQDDDPVWRDNVFRPDGTRRVLRRHEDGDCTFLGERGCTLPGDVRPLICRLYPYDYTFEGILPEPAKGCPVELLAAGENLFEVLAMPGDEARRWHRQLYDEILAEPTPGIVGHTSGVPVGLP